jgi:hypothetical protein
MEMDHQLLPLKERLVDEQIDVADKERRDFAAESKRLRAVARKLVRTPSERLRSAARKLSEESQRLQTEATRLQKQEEAKTELLASLQFEKTLCCLKRNAAETTVVDLDRYNDSDGYGKLLGEALEGNTVVADLILNVQTLLPSRCDSVSIPFVAQLLKFLSTSTSLLRVQMINSNWFPCMPRTVLGNLTELILDSILENSRIVKLTVKQTVHVASLQKIANARMPLTSLTISFPNLQEFCVMEQDISTVATCIASLSHLEYLELIVERSESLSVAILTELNRSNSGLLRQLRLNLNHAMNGPFFMALSQLMMGSATAMRLDFVLSSIALSWTDVEDVLRGLQHVNIDTGVTTMFVSQLTFSGCGFSNDKIASFLQTRIGHNEGYTFQSSLNELRFEPGYDCLLPQRIAESLFMVKSSDADANFAPTIGSTVRSVSVAGANRKVLDRFGLYANQLRLEKLKLARLSRVASRSLGVCLPKLQSLKELKLAEVAPGGPQWILRGLRRSSTLISVESIDAKGDSSFGAGQLRLLEAYCERNMRLGELLDNEAGLEWHMLPTLLQVAKQVPMARVTNLVRGLLSHDDKTS